MKKYKHITGEIAIEVPENGPLARYKVNHGFISTSFVENTSDWKEIIGKNYEILEVTQPYLKAIYKLAKNRQFGSSYNGDVYYYNGSEYRGFDMMDNIKKNGWKINSVKRLSDGKVFTIEDRVKPTNLKISDDKGFVEISKIEIYDNKCFISTAHHYFSRDIEDVITEKTPMRFTTEDGVELKCGDTFYVVELKYMKYIGAYSYPQFKKVTEKESVKHKIFYSEERALEYILMNKLCLSINDVMNSGYGICNSENLKNLVKSKL